MKRGKSRKDIERRIEKDKEEEGEIFMYVDSNIFIFAAMDTGKIGEDCRKIVHLINSNQTAFTASFLVVDEVIWVLKKNVGKEDAIKITKAMLSLPIKWINVHRSIIIQMINIHESTILDPRDAIHLSSMKEFGVSTIVSEDKDFDRIKGIERLSASEFVEKFAP